MSQLAVIHRQTSLPEKALKTDKSRSVTISKVALRRLLEEHNRFSKSENKLTVRDVAQYHRAKKLLDKK